MAYCSWFTVIYTSIHPAAWLVVATFIDSNKSTFRHRDVIAFLLCRLPLDVNIRVPVYLFQTASVEVCTKWVLNNYLIKLIMHWVKRTLRRITWLVFLCRQVDLWKRFFHWFSSPCSWIGKNSALLNGSCSCVFFWDFLTKERHFIYFLRWNFWLVSLSNIFFVVLYFNFCLFLSFGSFCQFSFFG